MQIMLNPPNINPITNDRLGPGYNKLVSFGYEKTKAKLKKRQRKWEEFKKAKE